MDGRNCTGRKISLLNDSSDSSLAHSTFKPAPLTHAISYSHTSSLHSRSQSRTPSLSPQTPQLIRSTSSGASRTPSPLTPLYTSFGAASQYNSLRKSPQDQFFFSGNRHSSNMDDPNMASMYPPIPDATAGLASAYPIPPQLAPQQIAPQVPTGAQSLRRSSTSPSSEPSRVSTVSASSNSKQVPKKNQYPCPMAKQVGCKDFFTTSGHAARHAKKHTGKKDAFCPECNKAFTRKDNMEQHRRTHQNGRSARNSTDDSKVKKTTKQNVKKSAVKAESQQLEAAVEQQLADATQAQQAVQAIQTQMQPVTAQQPLLDPASLAGLIAAPGPYYLSNGGLDSGPIPPLPMAMPDLNSRPPLIRSNFTDSLGYMVPAPALVDPESLHYSYPSPGLSNGLNSLALAASEHSRLTAKRSSSDQGSSSAAPASSPSSESPSDETPSGNYATP